VVKRNKEYLGFVGEQASGHIDLFYSKNLINWMPYKRNPIIEGNCCRWPSVIRKNDWLYMFHTINYCKKEGSNIVLKKASVTKPNNFKFVKQVTFKVKGIKYNQNPFIFYDRLNKQYNLYYHSASDDNVSQIRVRHHSNVTKLDKAKDRIVCFQNESGKNDRNGLAAPSMIYIDGKYILQVESKIRNTWVIDAYVSAFPDRGFKRLKKPILSHDQACPFPHIEDKKIYNFIAERGGIRILDSAGIEALWNPWFLGLVVYKEADFLSVLKSVDK